jgi:hypothetical protein
LRRAQSSRSLNVFNWYCILIGNDTTMGVSFHSLAARLLFNKPLFPEIVYAKDGSVTHYISYLSLYTPH